MGSMTSLPLTLIMQKSNYACNTLAFKSAWILCEGLVHSSPKFSLCIARCRVWRAVNVGQDRTTGSHETQGCLPSFSTVHNGPLVTRDKEYFRQTPRATP